MEKVISSSFDHSLHLIACGTFRKRELEVEVEVEVEAPSSERLFSEEEGPDWISPQCDE